MIHVLFATGILLISVASYFYSKRLQESRDAYDRLTHTYEVLLTNVQVASSLRLAEGYSRGYVVVQDTSMLNGYYATMERMWSRFQDLEKHIQDNATQRVNVSNLKNSLVQKQAVMDSLISLAPSKDPRLPRIVQHGNQLTEKLSRRSHNINDEELRLKERRSDSIKRGQDVVSDYGILCLGVAVFFFFLKYILSYLQSQGIRTINAQLERSNRELEAKVSDRTEDLQVQIALRNQELARKNRELEEARRFQMSLIPVLDVPQDKWEASAHIWPAEDVGGDYYDYKISDDGDELLLAVGDAAGHGLMAAMIVSNVHSYWHGFADREPADELMSRISNGLYALKLQMAIMAMAVIRVQPGKLEITSAAMPPFLLYSKKENRIEVITIRSMFLGSAISGNYKPSTYNFQPGDLFLCCSDGLIEARNLQGELYGIQRLKESLNRYLHLPLRQLTQAIYQDMRAFTGERPQQDDVTVLAVRTPAQPEDLA